jgi:hypothetical protein
MMPERLVIDTIFFCALRRDVIEKASAVASAPNTFTSMTSSNSLLSASRVPASHVTEHAGVVDQHVDGCSLALSLSALIAGRLRHRACRS